ncbi:MAG TPA: glycosyltransferase [Candidatus Dojkabacteria bacterium]|nr:glycosyltransferase [Candidatus Dojkabacteria bacterium]
MKIVYLAAGTESTLGGETRVAMELSVAMSKYAEVAIIFTGKENRIYHEDGLLKVSLEGGEYTGGELGVFTPATVQFYFDFLDSFKPDVIHSHSAWLAPFIGQVWALNHNIPYFYTTHVLPSRISEFFEVSGDSFVYKMMDEAIFKKYFLGYLNNCTSVIALNEIANSQVRKYGYSGNMDIIPNGRFLKGLISLKLADIKSKKINLIFVGSVTIRKNQEYLLRVMKYLPKNFTLTLVGRFLFDEYAKKFKRLASKYKNVIVTGGVDPSEIPAYLERSHIFVSASTAEVQALSVIEALASGRPVVGLSNETIDELIDESNGMWLDKDTTPKDFAKAVVAISKLSSAEYGKLSRSARSRVSTLDWDNIANRTLGLYEKYLLSKESRVGSSKRIREMILKLPYFPGQTYLLSKYDENIGNIEKIDNVGKMAKLPKGTLVFAGVTIGLAALVFGGMKLSKFIKNSVKKK